MASSRGERGMGQIGGAPAKDTAPTPAPATPPAAAPPLTLAQYQAQAGAPAVVAGSDAVRFLEQATWGPTDNDLSHLRSVGIQTYLNEQFNTPPLFSDVQSNYPLTTLYPIQSTSVTGGCDTTCVRDNYTLYPLHVQFMNRALTGPDQLRERVAFALHQFIVVAGRDMNNNETSWYAPYLQ